MAGALAQTSALTARSKTFTVRVAGLVGVVLGGLLGAWVGVLYELDDYSDLPSLVSSALGLAVAGALIGSLGTASAILAARAFVQRRPGSSNLFYVSGGRYRCEPGRAPRRGFLGLPDRP